MRTSTVDTWMFDLARFDEPDPPAGPPADPPADPVVEDPPADPADPEPEPDKGKDLAADVAKWKAMARKHEANARTNADKAKAYDKLEEAQKTEAQKLSDAKEAAEKRAVAAIERAVRAEVKALASNEFADPSDAVDAVKASDYVNDDGEIDVDAIKARLTELLEAKPHWKKASAPAAPPKPKPDPSQGPRQPVAPTDYRKAPREEYEAEMAKYGVRPRR